ncbi:agglutination protein [Aliivibrio finisterrensis]|uniref:Agglutination protein n=2 Tax=Vibrionaceae TaxID=641 RepID=A0A4Q5KYK6_9GAMM|nr:MULTISPECIES: TolC family outer membrane protein [Aliivibrio]MDD9178418.1 TolC family outer membrane protein [Aliivibrio sp. A6]RYU52377.1 agglutination protein [Aliivibrio finisterrensis]RYU54979.1 agglutination protein [Aliivibrio finisterrensis]RYU58013.1 agglutination protein [Aliivibrio finisterrensis]RYU66605.1 agglutination protein [Aliivibrio finisterrensis]
MKWMKLATYSSLLVLSVSTQAQTLEQAISQTLTTNPEVKKAYNSYLSFVADSESVSGNYLPSIDLDAGIGYENINDAESAGGDSTDLIRKDATLSLTQLIWDGSNTINDMDRTEAESESARLQLMSLAENKALDVSQVYLDAVKATEILALSESNLAIHKKIYKDIKKRAASGIGSTADVSQVEARIARAHGNLLAAQNNLFDTHTVFTQIVGSPPQALIYPRADANTLPLSQQEGIERAFEYHPVILTAQSDIKAAKYQYAQSKSTNYPTFSFEAAQTWRDDAGGIEGNSDEFSAMIRMRYNLYNGGSDSAQSDKSAYQLNMAKDLRDSAYRNVEEGFRLSWSALDLTLQQKEFLADHVDAASDTVIAYEKQYRIGKRTLLDLLNTENELFEARKSYLDAHYAEQFAKYRVLHATGTLLPSLLIDTPKEWDSKQSEEEDK